MVQHRAGEVAGGSGCAGAGAWAGTRGKSVCGRFTSAKGSAAHAGGRRIGGTLRRWRRGGRRRRRRWSCKPCCRSGAAAARSPRNPVAPVSSHVPPASLFRTEPSGARQASSVFAIPIAWVSGDGCHEVKSGAKGAISEGCTAVRLWSGGARVAAAGAVHRRRGPAPFVNLHACRGAVGSPSVTRTPIMFCRMAGGQRHDAVTMAAAAAAADEVD